MKSNKCNICSRQEYLVNLGSFNYCADCIFNEMKFSFEDNFLEMVMNTALFWEKEHREMDKGYEDLKRKGDKFLKRKKDE